MFNNLFSFSFFDKSAGFSIPDIASALLISFAIGLFIYFIYRKTFNGVMYSSSFGISLIAMDLTTTLVILAVTSNLITSLGMVGALSIIRFRTVVKEPLDIAFLFWSITVGIVVGAGLVPLAVIGSLFIGLILIIFVNRKTTETPYIVIVNCENSAAEKKALDIIRVGSTKNLLKSKAVTKNGIELTIEVRLEEASAGFINSLAAAEGVTNAVLVSYNGDYM